MWCPRLFLLPEVLLFLITTVPRFSYAQSTINGLSITTELTPTVSFPTTSSLIISSSTSPSISMFTTFTTSTSASSNTTTSSATSRKTQDPGLFPPAGASDPSNPETQRRDTAFNYYFLILAGFGIFVAIGLWWIRRRRKWRKEQMRLSGQNALARDLDGWVNTRRWMHGARRHNQTAAFVRREEGLNEHGEAPPPYQPKNEVTVAQDSAIPAQDPASGLSIPLRTLSRDEIQISHPPNYQETVLRQSTSTTRPDIATIRSTANVAPISSTHDVLTAGMSQPNG